MDKLMTDLKHRMEGAVATLKKEFAGLRTGRASAEFVAPVLVDAYGSKMPLSQVGSVNTPDARTISIQVWDKGLVQAVEKAIRDSDLGVSPAVDGDTLRIRMPEMTEERRQDLVKVARKYAEASRVAVRNVRRDGMEDVKKQQKDNALSEDEARRLSDNIQKLTDDAVAIIDAELVRKEADIMKV